MAGVVLIVEDEPQNRKLFRDVLNKFGYQTLEAVDGRQAIALAGSEKPGLILMDMQMPVMGGLEATKALKADPATRDITVLALTAHSMEGEGGAMLTAGCAGYITKPVSIRQFIQKVAEFLPQEG